MNHNAEEIKTSAVVQCLFRLTAAPFLIKMGLGRPFKQVPFLSCTVLTLSTSTSTHRHFHLHVDTHTHTSNNTHIASLYTYRATVVHTQPLALTHRHSDASKHVRTTPSSCSGVQAHKENIISHTQGLRQSLTHINLRCVTQTLFTHRVTTRYSETI